MLAFFLICFLFVIVFLYEEYSFDYSIGASTYARDNYQSNEADSCWQSYLDERKELSEAWHKRDLREFVLELFDCQYGLVKYLMALTLPRSIYVHPLTWYCVFVILFPAGIKLTHRYRKYGCIRN